MRRVCAAGQAQPPGRRCAAWGEGGARARRTGRQSSSSGTRSCEGGHRQQRRHIRARTAWAARRVGRSRRGRARDSTTFAKCSMTSAWSKKTALKAATFAAATCFISRWARTRSKWRLPKKRQRGENVSSLSGSAVGAPRAPRFAPARGTCGKPRSASSPDASENSSAIREGGVGGGEDVAELQPL